MNTILNYYISNMFYTLSHIQSQLIKQNPKMSSQTAPSNPTINPYQYLQIVYNADSTFTSHWKIPSTPPSQDPNRPTPILSKDISLNQSNKNWARIFLPRQALNNSSSSKLLLKVYFMVEASSFNHNHHRPLSELKHRQHSHKIKTKARREH